ncbi:MAG: EAL domain-containing protein [Deltaproteobacteria bacterium]|nr:EAL domain-containing protein [Deltaproteobacteria bacterium]MBW2533240.1 EAL domain-containing protein [Deltaproteobacteria bacterium]
MTASSQPPPYADLASALLDGAFAVVAVWRRERPLWIAPTSGSIQDLLGMSATQFVAQPLEQHIHPEDVSSLRNTLDELLRVPGARRTARYRMRHKIGRYVNVESSAVNRLHDKQVRGIVVHTRRAGGDGKSRSAMEETDPGSGRLPFMLALQEVVDLKQDKFWRLARFAHSTALDPSLDFAVMIVEIDRFKMMLGTYGQEVVDDMLVTVGNRMRSVLGPRDIIAKLSPGEFGILLRGEADSTRVDVMSRKIQAVVSRHDTASTRKLSASATIGVVTSQRPYTKGDEMMRDAAAAVERARHKHTTRRAQFQTRMRAEDTDLIHKMHELRAALRQNEFAVYYQPIITLESKQIAGFEALVRWSHPERGVLTPDHFLPAAEEAGLMGAVDNWVLLEACRQAVEWEKSSPAARELTVSVNVSPDRLSEKLREDVEDSLRQTGLPPSRLKLEVTENAVMNKKEAATRAISMLRLYGVQLSLDDFGTGYSSFGYLLDYPFDTIKIDRSFVSHVGTDDPRAGIVKAILNLAHSLGMTVVAEGIETREQYAALLDLGCEFGQGYLFAKPMPADEASAALRARSVPPAGIRR